MGDRLPNPLDRARTPADRQRTWRARQRAGCIVAPVVVPPVVLGLLLDLNWITPEASENRQAVADAIALVLSEAARHGLKETVTRLHAAPCARCRLRS